MTELFTFLNVSSLIVLHGIIADRLPRTLNQVLFQHFVDERKCQAFLRAVQVHA